MITKQRTQETGKALCQRFSLDTTCRSLIIADTVRLPGRLEHGTPYILRINTSRNMRGLFIVFEIHTVNQTPSTWSIQISLEYQAKEVRRLSKHWRRLDGSTPLSTVIRWIMDVRLLPEILLHQRVRDSNLEPWAVKPLTGACLALHKVFTHLSDSVTHLGLVEIIVVKYIF
jgi:hypothetical protein